MRNLAILALAVLLLGCGGGDVVHETELNGYIGGRLRVKYTDKLEEVKLEDGKPGYLLTTEIRYSEGSKNRQSTQTRIWMHKDFTLVKRVNQIREQKKVLSEQVTSFADGKITYTDNASGTLVEEQHEWKHAHPLIGEVHPWLYGNQLLKETDSQPYWIFHEPLRDGAPVRVKHKGKTTTKLGDKTVECIRYSVRSLQKAGAYNDYYIDEKSKRILKIVMGDLEFVPPGTY